jgi:hypothetical protein
MAEFDSQREAKEYLAGKIVTEAKREGKPLSEIERKMLYFSETDWTLPGILEVNAEFERHYDEDEYEGKICALGQAIEAQLKGAGAEESDAWYAAIQKLSEGDHYLLVLLNTNLVSQTAAKHPLRRLLKLWFIAFAITLGILAVMLLYTQLFRSH